MDSAEPVFIHSLFRSGSTYLFSAFRRSSAGYWCYQEPLHELAFLCRNDPSKLEEGNDCNKAALLRHPLLEESYFKELVETWPSWKEVISPEIIYDAYFAGCNDDFGQSYWQTLIKAARGRPVFQECRTSGRIGAIKSSIGGKHLYLWRNPWDQWWSYKVTPYFDAASCLMVHAASAPLAAKRLLASLDVAAYRGNNLGEAFAFYGERPLSSEQSYQIFYLLWCYGMREGLRHADLLVNIDRLSDSADYQVETHCSLQALGISDVEFRDCSIPQGIYSDAEIAWFETREASVHSLLIEDCWLEADIPKILNAREHYQPNCRKDGPSNQDLTALLEQSRRGRDLAKQCQDTLAARVKTDALRLSNCLDLEKRLAVAESLVEQFKMELRSIHAANHHHWLLCQGQARRLEDLQRSYSWRITAPLRRFGAIIHLFRMEALAGLCVSALKRLVPFVAKRPRLGRLIMAVLTLFPRLESRLFRSVLGAGAPPEKLPSAIRTVSKESLSLSGTQTYDILLHVIERKRKDQL